MGQTPEIPPVLRQQLVALDANRDRIAAELGARPEVAILVPGPGRRVDRFSALLVGIVTADRRAGFVYYASSAPSFEIRLMRIFPEGLDVYAERRWHHDGRTWTGVEGMGDAFTPDASNRALRLLTRLTHKLERGPVPGSGALAHLTWADACLVWDRLRAQYADLGGEPPPGLVEYADCLAAHVGYPGRRRRSDSKKKRGKARSRLSPDRVHTWLAGLGHTFRELQQRPVNSI